MLQHIVSRQDENRIAEVVAEEHRPDGDPADDQRRDGEQYERQSHHPRAFMWGPGMMSVPMIVIVVTMRVAMPVTGIRLVTGIGVAMQCGAFGGGVMVLAGRRESLRTMEGHEHQAETIE